MNDLKCTRELDPCSPHFDRQIDLHGSLLGPDRGWHAIWVTAKGEDYCRESAPSSVGVISDMPPRRRISGPVPEFEAWKFSFVVAGDAAEKYFRDLFARTADHTARENVVGFHLQRW